VTELRDLVAGELGCPVDPRVTAIASAIAAKHGAASRAVLFYGSCLREQRLEGLMLDFYLIVSDYRAAYRKHWLALANRLIPPNVFYFEHDGLAAKYAVLSEADFARECSRQARSTSVVARFAQPSRLAWVAGAQARGMVTDAIAHAAPTLLDWTLPLSESGSPIELWKRAFALTFNAELRAERFDRSAAIVDADLNRYSEFGSRALLIIADRALLMRRERAERWWKRMQWKGKALSILRLAKAAFTFAGGADYIAWKINRHAQADIRLKPWQRRHPLLAGISLLPRLLKSGAVR
jgi:hypothetical protein